MLHAIKTPKEATDTSHSSAPVAIAHWSLQGKGWFPRGSMIWGLTSSPCGAEGARHWRRPLSAASLPHLTAVTK